MNFMKSGKRNGIQTLGGQNLPGRSPAELRWQDAGVGRDRWSPPGRAGPGQARPVGPEGRLQFRPWVSAEAPRSPPRTLARTPGVGRVEGVGWGEMVDLYI